MTQHEALVSTANRSARNPKQLVPILPTHLQRVAVFSFAVYNLQNVLVKFVTLFASKKLKVKTKKDCGSPCFGLLAHLIVTRRPVVTGTTTMLGHENVLRVVQLGVGRVDDALNDSGLQIEQHGPRYVVVIVSLNWPKCHYTPSQDQINCRVYLVEEHVLTIVSFGRKILQRSVYKCKPNASVH